MTFEKLSSNLNLLMAKARLNANELARRTGIPASSVKKIRNNINPNPTLATLAPIANYFSITISQLIGDISMPAEERHNINSSHDTTQNTIPLISWNEAHDWPKHSKPGYPTIISERPYSQDAFGLIVEEETWKAFPKGTILLVDPAITPQQHDYVIVSKDNQNTAALKQVLIEDNEIFLKSILIDNHVIQKSGEHKILGVIMEYRQYLR
jgi:transcriptional regulator with XRE-family HTH domain